MTFDPVLLRRSLLRADTLIIIAELPQDACCQALLALEWVVHNMNPLLY